MKKTSDVRIGVSGWNYKGWRGVFYPKGLAQRRELEFASRALNSIEINGSFYSLQRPESYRRWRAETPDNFIFGVKGGRFITHMKKLHSIESPLANFFDSGDQFQSSIAIEPDSTRMQLKEFSSPRPRVEVAVPA